MENGGEFAVQAPHNLFHLLPPTIQARVMCWRWRGWLATRLRCCSRRAGTPTRSWCVCRAMLVWAVGGGLAFNRMQAGRLHHVIVSVLDRPACKVFTSLCCPAGCPSANLQLRQEARAKSRQRSRRRRAGSRDAQELEAVVVAAAATDEEKEGKAAGLDGSQGGAAAAEPAGPAGAAGDGGTGAREDVEAGTMVQECCEERGGVLHTQAKLRQRNGRACRTICRLMPKSAASEPAALSEPLPNGPAAKAAEGEAAPAPPTPRQGPLEAIAEEGAAQQAQQAEQAQQLEEQPPTPPDSPRSPRQQPGGIWGQLVSCGWVVHRLSCCSRACSAVPVRITPCCPHRSHLQPAALRPSLPHPIAGLAAGLGAGPPPGAHPVRHLTRQHSIGRQLAHLLSRGAGQHRRARLHARHW